MSLRQPMVRTVRFLTVSTYERQVNLRTAYLTSRHLNLHDPILTENSDL